MVTESLNLTAPLQAAIAEAEELIANAPFIRTEQDRLEGYDYLSGRIRMAMQMAFDYDLDRPLFVNPTHQFSRQGLDNPDAIYFNAFLREGVEYVVRGRRGTSADLSFQVMGGMYSADSAATSMMAFDDRELEKDADGNFEFRYTAEPGAKSMIVREVFNDWDTEERGTLTIERPDLVDRPAKPLTEATLRKKYEVAARSLTGSIQTWFAFPQFFERKEPVNTLTRRSRRPAACRHSGRASGTTSSRTTRRWSSACRSAPTAPTRVPRWGRTGTPPPTTRRTRPRSPRRRPTSTPTGSSGSWSQSARQQERGRRSRTGWRPPATGPAR